MKKFIVINEEFICKNCGGKNPKLKGSCRNHCRNCLYSLHVDENGPGDRSSNCHGLMQPIKIDHSGKKGWILSHKCSKCGKIIPNKTAPDDNFEEIIKIAAQASRTGKKSCQISRNSKN